MAYSKKEKIKIVNDIFNRIAVGESLRNTLKNNISSQTFYEWIDQDETKSKQYARVCEERADSIFEDIIDIADDQEHDIYIDQDGKKQTNHNVIQRSRLRVDSRKWMLSKMMPKKYGDKIDVTSDGKSLAPTSINFTDAN